MSNNFHINFGKTRTKLTRIYILYILLLITEIKKNNCTNFNPLEQFTKSENFNTIDLTEIDENIFGISASIGYPPQKFLLRFDITSQYTWVGGKECLFCSYDNLFNYTASQTAIPTNISIHLDNLKPSLKGEIVFDYINVKIFSANNIPFLIVNDDSYIDGLDGVIGFGYSNSKSDINFSILDKLFNSNQIGKKLFALKFSEATVPKLVLGILPQEIENNIKNYTVCNVDQSIDNWNCKISHLLVGSEINFYKAISIDKSAMFSTNINLINIPIENIQFFMQNYFMKIPHYNYDMCKVKPDGQKFFIICNMDLFDLKVAPFLHLIINGYAYQISPVDLFSEIFNDSYIRYYLFNIVFTNTPGNQWILGYSFMKHFYMVFDKEKSQVGFYSGVKYDLRKFTRDSAESICLYNYSVYIFFASLVGLSMGYILYKKKQDEIFIANALIEEKKGNKMRKVKDDVKTGLIS